MKTKEIDILDILLILAKHKKFIIWTTIIVSVVTVVYVLLAPQYWVSTVTILPTQEQRSQLPFGSSSFLGFGSSFLGGAFQTQGIDLITIMNSRTFSEDVINKFHLIEYFEIEDPDSLVVMEIAVKTLNEVVKRIGINDETGLISINIETKDKYLSADIANYYWQKLEKYNIESRMSKGKQKRIFIEKRLTEVKDTLDSLSLSLNEFQKKYSTISLESQTKSVIDLYADLTAQKISTEIELEYQKNYFDINSLNIIRLDQKLSIINEKIKELEFAEADKKVKFGLNISDIPDLNLKYAELIAELEIQREIYEFLFPQFESAKIEEVKDLPTIEIIDIAVPAGLRSKPKRAIICIISFLIALSFSISLSIMFEKFKLYLNYTESKEKLSSFKKNL